MLPSPAAPCPMLHDVRCALDGAGAASDYAAVLLGSLGATVERRRLRQDAHPARAWAASGAMALTGGAAGPALMCPAPLASCVEGVRLACAALANLPEAVLPGAETLGERAAFSALTRQGAVAPGGACRLLRAGDGWLAVNLPRDDDWTLLPAWLETDFAMPAGEAAWNALAGLLNDRPIAPLVERARLVGLAAAGADVVEAAPAVGWYSVISPSSPRPGGERGKGGTSPPGQQKPLVVDLSSLWAGPLCSHLLQLAGARVVKVESLQRPDGARRGPAGFYDLLSHGKASVALDFSSSRGIAQLRALLARADVVIEASRPRALRQLGIRAEDMIAAAPHLTWIAISGHGRAEPQANWIAYGDDAAVAAGLSGLMADATGEALFCGDAIADPLTGWHAALAALASLRSDGGRLISLALTDVVRHCLNFELPDSPKERRQRWQEWQALIDPADVAPPHARQPAGVARALGADTQSVLTELGIAC